jgi:hypothetical protein
MSSLNPADHESIGAGVGGVGCAVTTKAAKGGSIKHRVSGESILVGYRTVRVVVLVVDNSDKAERQN